MKIFYLDSRENVCGYYRCFLPAKALQSLRLADVVLNTELIHAIPDYEELGKRALALIVNCDILQLQQSYVKGNIDLIALARKYGAKVVLDTDDRCDTGTPGDPKTIKRCELWESSFSKIWPHVDAFTCPSEGLKKWLESEFGKPAYVVPNYLDVAAPRWKVPRRKVHTTVVGWSGCDTHRSDLEMLRGVLPHVEGAEVQVQGYDPEFPEFNRHNGVRVDPEIYDFVTAYPKRIAEFDIGLCPLVDHPFNVYGKSDLKFLDYSMIGAATIASDRHPYNLTIEHGKNGLLVGDDPDEWLEAIHYLVNNPAERRRLAANARHYVVKERDIRKGARRWLEVYKKIAWEK